MDPENSPASTVEQAKAIERSSEQKLQRLLWSDDEARVVGEFLLGKQPEPTHETAPLWQKIGENCDVPTSDLPNFLTSSKTLLHQLSEHSSNSQDNPKELPEDKDQYKDEVTMRAKVIQELAVDCLANAGILEGDQRVVARGRLRSPKKRTYSQSSAYGSEVEEEGYVGFGEGGPHIRTKILSPRAEYTINSSNKRQRRSLGREIVHSIRGLSNRHLWKGSEADAHEAGLSQSAAEKKREQIGGFYVGSHHQGSEEVGHLYSLILDRRAESETTHISDILPLVHSAFETRLDKFEVAMHEYETKERKKPPGTRYVAGRYALLHHLHQLDELGYGDIDAIQLVALGAYGYSSLEKLPALIQLGIVDSEDANNMSSVVENVTNWLTSPSESGYHKASQNT